MRETHTGNRYIPGDYWKECPICGFDYLRSEMLERWDGLVVCKPDWDPEHPLDDKRNLPKEESFKGD